MAWKHLIGRQTTERHAAPQARPEVMPEFDPRWLGRDVVTIVVDGRRWHVTVKALPDGQVLVRLNGVERVVLPAKIRAREGASAAVQWAWKMVRVWAEHELAARMRVEQKAGAAWSEHEPLHPKSVQERRR